MASVAITQVYLMQATAPNTGTPINSYWNANSTAEMNIDPAQITAVSYVWDPVANNFIPGIIQIYLFGIVTPIYSTNSYASVVAYMNP